MCVHMHKCVSVDSVSSKMKTKQHSTHTHTAHLEVRALQLQGTYSLNTLVLHVLGQCWLFVWLLFYHKGAIAPLYILWGWHELASITPIRSENLRFCDNSSIWNPSSRKGTYGQNMGVLKK